MQHEHPIVLVKKPNLDQCSHENALKLATDVRGEFDVLLIHVRESEGED